MAKKKNNVTCTVQFLQAVSECLDVEDTADRYNLAYFTRTQHRPTTEIQRPESLALFDHHSINY